MSSAATRAIRKEIATTFYKMNDDHQDSLSEILEESLPGCQDCTSASDLRRYLKSFREDALIGILEVCNHYLRMEELEQEETDEEQDQEEHVDGKQPAAEESGEEQLDEEDHGESQTSTSTLVQTLILLDSTQGLLCLVTDKSRIDSQFYEIAADITDDFVLGNYLQYMHECRPGSQNYFLAADDTETAIPILNTRGILFAGYDTDMEYAQLVMNAGAFDHGIKFGRDDHLSPTERVRARVAEILEGCNDDGPVDILEVELPPRAFWRKHLLKQPFEGVDPNTALWRTICATAPQQDEKAEQQKNAQRQEGAKQQEAADITRPVTKIDLMFAVPKTDASGGSSVSWAKMRQGLEKVASRVEPEKPETGLQIKGAGHILSSLQPASTQPAFGRPSFGQPSLGRATFGQPSWGLKSTPPSQPSTNAAATTPAAPLPPASSPSSQHVDEVRSSGVSPPSPGADAHKSPYPTETRTTGKSASPDASGQGQTATNDDQVASPQNHQAEIAPNEPQDERQSISDSDDRRFRDSGIHLEVEQSLLSRVKPGDAASAASSPKQMPQETSAPPSPTLRPQSKPEGLKPKSGLSGSDLALIRDMIVQAKAEDTQRIDHLERRVSTLESTLAKYQRFVRKNMPSELGAFGGPFTDLVVDDDDDVDEECDGDDFDETGLGIEQSGSLRHNALGNLSELVAEYGDTEEADTLNGEAKEEEAAGDSSYDTKKSSVKRDCLEKEQNGRTAGSCNEDDGSSNKKHKDTDGDDDERSTKVTKSTISSALSAAKAGSSSDAGPSDATTSTTSSDGASAGDHNLKRKRSRDDNSEDLTTQSTKTQRTSPVLDNLASSQSSANPSTNGPLDSDPYGFETPVCTCGCVQKYYEIHRAVNRNTMSQCQNGAECLGNRFFHNTCQPQFSRGKYGRNRAQCTVCLQHEEDYSDEAAAGAPGPNSSIAALTRAHRAALESQASTFTSALERSSADTAPSAAEDLYTSSVNGTTSSDGAEDLSSHTKPVTPDTASPASFSPSTNPTTSSDPEPAGGLREVDPILGKRGRDDSDHYDSDSGAPSKKARQQDPEQQYRGTKMSRAKRKAKRELEADEDGEDKEGEFKLFADGSRKRVKIIKTKSGKIF